MIDTLLPLWAGLGLPACLWAIFTSLMVEPFVRHFESFALRLTGVASIDRWYGLCELVTLLAKEGRDGMDEGRRKRKAEQMNVVLEEGWLAGWLAARDERPL